MQRRPLGRRSHMRAAKPLIYFPAARPRATRRYPAPSMAGLQPITFARGAPSADIMPADDVREAAARVLAADPAGALAYGVGTGYGPLREWIAERHDVEPERVLVTNGSLQADAFLFETLVAAGDAVVVENPTYDRTLLNLRNRGAELHGVDLHTDGID